MNTPASLLKEIAEDAAFGSYYQVAKYLKVSQAYIYARKKDGNLSDANLIKLATVVKIDPMVLISAKNLENASDELSKSFWKSVFEKTMPAMLVSKT